MRDLYRSKPADRHDVIVVGAGLGGLSAAAILARRGARVLVVDRHYVAGGNATVFRRRGYEFDVGLHYIGGCGRDGVVPRILRAGGVSEVEFEELDPDGFDTLVYPDFTFRIPRGVERLQARLIEQFPAERRGIERFTGIVGGLVRLMRGARRASDYLALTQAVWPLIRWSRSTYAALIADCTQDPRLKAVLAGQSGDYAVPPSRAPALVGAGLIAHYMDGAYFPKGGGQVLADHLADSILANGGTILLRTSARRIVVEKRRVTGVELESKHLGTFKVDAPVVVSNADLKQTMSALLGREHLRARTRETVASFTMAPALGVVYLGIRRDLRAEGHPRTNYWIHRSHDAEAPYAALQAAAPGHQQSAYVTIASLKDPENAKIAPPGCSNLQIMALAPSRPEAWGVTEAEVRDGSYRANEVYRRTKNAFADALIALTERVLPGVSEQVVYREVATPLTHRRYTSATHGTSYGIELTTDQFLWNRPGAGTEIDGLFLAGASCRTGPGIVGVLLSGVMAAAAVDGPSVLREVYSEQEPRGLRVAVTA